MHIVYSYIKTTIPPFYILSLDAGNMCFFLIVKGCLLQVVSAKPYAFELWGIYMAFMWRVLWKWLQPSQLSLICHRVLSLLTPLVQTFPGCQHWGGRVSRLGMEWGGSVCMCVSFSLFSQNSKAKYNWFLESSWKNCPCLFSPPVQIIESWV